MVVSLAQTILEHQGYEVLTAPSGEMALQIAEAHRGRIHLLITNHCLAGESGSDVANRLSATQGAMRVLQISGYPQSHLIADGTKAKGGSFLQKPFTASELISTVQRILESS